MAFTHSGSQRTLSELVTAAASAFVAQNGFWRAFPLPFKVHAALVQRCSSGPCVLRLRKVTRAMQEPCGHRGDTLASTTSNGI